MKRTNRLTNVTMIVIFAAMLLYIGTYFISSLQNRIVTAASVQTTVREYAGSSGIVIREEEIQESKYTYVDVTASEGKRVASGEAIAVSYANEKALERASRIRQLELEIAGINTLLGSLSTAEDIAGRDTAIRHAVSTLSAAVSRNDLKNLDAAALRLRSLVFEEEEAAITQEELFALEDELAGLRSSTASNISGITAKKPGVFSTLLDGYEHLGVASIKDLNPGKLHTLLTNRTEFSDAAIGKLVVSNTWYYAALVAEDEVPKLQDSTHIYLEFGRYYNTPIPAQIESISDAEDGECAVVFSCFAGLSETLAVRQAAAEIVYGEHSGLRVPREALHAEDADANVLPADDPIQWKDKENATKTFVYTLTGPQVEKKYVDVVYESESFYLVYPSTDADALRDGDEIIVEGKRLFDGKIVR